MNATLDTPDLANDQIVYRYTRIPQPGRLGRQSLYSIARRINDGAWQTIGQVVKTRDADWGAPAEWQATGNGHRGFASNRADAAKRLEIAMQPAEYHAARKAQYEASRLHLSLAVEAANDRVKIIEHRGSVDVTVDGVKAAHVQEFIVRYDTAAGSEERVEIMSHTAAMSHAESIAKSLRRSLVK